MAGPKILVLGGTGPAGICLLRELLFRNHAVVVYARSPSKIPADLKSNPLLEIVEGTFADLPALSTAVAQCHTILSLLGPITARAFPIDTYSSFYLSLFTLMREHHVRRIFAMATVAVSQPGDQFAFTRFLLVLVVRTLAQSAYRAMHELVRVFAEEAEGIDWTVYRIAGIPGGCSEEEWRRDREDGEVFEGCIGEKGWWVMQKEGALARWLVDAAEDGKEKWIGKMPAVGRLAWSGKRKTE